MQLAYQRLLVLDSPSCLRRRRALLNFGWTGVLVADKHQVASSLDVTVLLERLNSRLRE